MSMSVANIARVCLSYSSADNIGPDITPVGLKGNSLFNISIGNRPLQNPFVKDINLTRIASCHLLCIEYSVIISRTVCSKYSDGTTIKIVSASLIASYNVSV